MSQCSDESCYSNCASYSTYDGTTFRAEAMSVEMCYRMSVVVVWSIVCVVPVPIVAAEITIATIEVANTTFPTWEITVAVETRRRTWSHCVMVWRGWSVVTTVVISTSIVSTMMTRSVVAATIHVMFHAYTTISEMHFTTTSVLSICINTEHCHCCNHCNLEKCIELLHNCNFF